MVFKYGDSSDSEEERHDRFRNERNQVDVKLSINALPERSFSRSEPLSLPRPRICSLCDRSITSCICGKTSYRNSSRKSPSRERIKIRDISDDKEYSRKKRSSEEEHSSSKRRSKDKERIEKSSDISSKKITESFGSSKSYRDDPVHKEEERVVEHHEKKCKKKLKKEKLKEEEHLKKKHSDKYSKDHEIPNRNSDHNNDVYIIEIDDLHKTEYIGHKKDRNRIMTDSKDKIDSYTEDINLKKDKHRSKSASKRRTDSLLYDHDELVDRSYTKDFRAKEYNDKKEKCRTKIETKKWKEGKSIDYNFESDENLIYKTKEEKTQRKDKHKEKSDRRNELSNDCERDLNSFDKAKEKDIHRNKSKIECKRRKDDVKSDSEQVNDSRKYLDSTLHKKRIKNSHRSRSNSEEDAVTLKDPSSTKLLKCIVDSVSKREEKRRGHTDREEESDSYGPSLPPRVKIENYNREKSSARGDEKGAYGPILLSERRKSMDERDVYGPSKHDNEKDAYGPSLPQRAGSRNESGRSTYGPKLPSHQEYGPTLPPCISHTEDSVGYGPSISDGQEERKTDDSDYDDTFGPLPEGSTLTPSQILLQHRANLLRLHSLNKVDKEEVKREEWMMELPDRHRSGLSNVVAARTFRTKATDAEIDSSWTDSPAEKLRKQALAQIGSSLKNTKEDLAREISKKRDKYMEKLVKSSKRKKSSKSLLELHQEKLNKEKKKAKKEGKKEERRPFNRETDLSTTRLTQAQKQAIYKKAHDLNSRFSSGHTKYL